MRTLAAIAAALILAPAAGAAKPVLPIRYDGLHALRLAPASSKQLTSCTIHPKSSSKAAKVFRKVHPVSCEQPPRTQLNGLSGAIQALLTP